MTRKTERLDIRLTPSAKEKLVNDSTVAGMSQGEYVCALIEQKGVSSKDDRNALIYDLQQTQRALSETEDRLMGIAAKMDDDSEFDTESLKREITRLEQLRADLYHKYFTDWGY